MNAAPLREPRPASPEPYAPGATDEREHRRPAGRPQVASSRQPKLNLDSLAIGAPLTAALGGVLLTDGNAVRGDATTGVADSHGGVRPGHGEKARHPSTRASGAA